MLRFRCCAAAFLTAFSSSPARADIVYDDLVHAAQEYREDFDGLPSANVNSAFTGAPLTQIDVPSLTGFEATKLVQTASSSNFMANDGSLATAGMYSFGAAGDDERALGALAGDTRTMAFGFSLLNSHAEGQITSITVEFTQETWRSPPAATNWFFAAWGTSASAGVTSSNYLFAAGMSPVSDLDLFQQSGVAAAGAVNGNDAANQSSRSLTFTVDLSAGERFYLRWQDVNNAGDDAGLAIDDLRLSFTHTHQVSAVPESSASAALALTMVAIWHVFKGRLGNAWRRAA